MTTATVTKKVGEDLSILVKDEVVVPPPPPPPPTNAFKEHIIPGRIQAEDYDLGGEGVGYHDIDPENRGKGYRNDGVDVESGTVINIGYLVKGEWTKYTLAKVTAGRYRLSAQVASINALGKFNVLLDDKIIATISVPNTADWKAWRTVTADVDVVAAKTLKVDVLEGNFNLDYLEFSNFSVPPVPPVGGISTGFVEALNTAGEGREVKFAGGLSIPLPLINLRQGVSLDMGGSTIVGTVPGAFNEDKPQFRLNGNQRLVNGSIAGKNIIAAGVIGSGDNLIVDRINVTDCNFVGIWLRDGRLGKLTNFKLRNTSASNTSWASGECCFTDLNSFEIGYGEVASDSKTRGYGFKALYGNGFLKDMKFHHLKTNMHHESLWANGASRNIGFEIHEHSLGNIEIYDCEFRNQVSLSVQYQGGKTIMRNNLLDLGGDTYGVETILDNFEFYENTIRNAGMFFANFKKQNYRWANWNVYKNKFLTPSGIPGGWGAMFLIGESGVSNVNVYDNDIEVKGGFNTNAPLLRYRGVTGGFNFNTNNRVKVV